MDSPKIISPGWYDIKNVMARSHISVSHRAIWSLLLLNVWGYKAVITSVLNWAWHCWLLPGSTGTAGHREGWGVYTEMERLSLWLHEHHCFLHWNGKVVIETTWAYMFLPWNVNSCYYDSGLPWSGKSQGNSSLSQSQGKVREFCCKSGNFLISYQSQGKVKEFWLWSLSMHIFYCLGNDIWTRTKS